MKSLQILSRKYFLLFLFSVVLIFSCHQAWSLELFGKIGFIVDRCGGDYDCEDVNLILLNTESAEIFSGKEINDHDKNGIPGHVNGYEFNFKGKKLFISEIDGRSRLNDAFVDVSINGGIVYEGKNTYIYVYAACANGGGRRQLITSLQQNKDSCPVNYVEVDKKMKKIVRLSGGIASQKCGAAGDDCRCSPKEPVISFRFMNKNLFYLLSSDFCDSGMLKIQKDERTIVVIPLKEMPLAIDN